VNTRRGFVTQFRKTDVLARTGEEVGRQQTWNRSLQNDAVTAAIIGLTHMTTRSKNRNDIQYVPRCEHFEGKRTIPHRGGLVTLFSAPPPCITSETFFGDFASAFVVSVHQIDNIISNITLRKSLTVA